MNIMFVDDNKDLIFLFESIFCDNNINYNVFSDPIKALEFYKNNYDEIDLVISDYDMPKMNGKKLLFELINVNSDVKFVFLTGSSFNIDEETMSSKNVLEVYQKPIFKIKEFIQKIKNHMIN